VDGRDEPGHDVACLVPDLSTVMPGLVPGIHVFTYIGSTGVDGRDKPTTVRHVFCLMKCTALVLLGFSWLRII
jgi:hypothetical protein